MSRITAVVKGTATTTHTECLSAFTLRLEQTNICVGTNYRAHGSDNIISHRVILDLRYYYQSHKMIYISLLKIKKSFQKMKNHIIYHFSITFQSFFLVIAGD